MRTAVLGTSTSYQVRPCVLQREGLTRRFGGQYASPSTGYEVLPTGSGSSTPVRPNRRPEQPSKYAPVDRNEQRPVVVLVLRAHDVHLLRARSHRVEDDRVEEPRSDAGHRADL